MRLNTRALMGNRWVLERGALVDTHCRFAHDGYIDSAGPPRPRHSTYMSAAQHRAQCGSWRAHRRATDCKALTQLTPPSCPRSCFGKPDDVCRLTMFSMQEPSPTRAPNPLLWLVGVSRKATPRKQVAHNLCFANMVLAGGTAVASGKSALKKPEKRHIAHRLALNLLLTTPA